MAIHLMCLLAGVPFGALILGKLASLVGLGESIIGVRRSRSSCCVVAAVLRLGRPPRDRRDALRARAHRPVAGPARDRRCRLMLRRRHPHPRRLRRRSGLPAEPARHDRPLVPRRPVLGRASAVVDGRVGRRPCRARPGHERRTAPTTATRPTARGGSRSGARASATSTSAAATRSASCAGSSTVEGMRGLRWVSLFDGQPLEEPRGGVGDGRRARDPGRRHDPRRHAADPGRRAPAPAEDPARARPLRVRRLRAGRSRRAVGARRVPEPAPEGVVERARVRGAPRRRARPRVASSRRASAPAGSCGARTTPRPTTTRTPSWSSGSATRRRGSATTTVTGTSAGPPSRCGRSSRRADRRGTATGPRSPGRDRRLERVEGREADSEGLQDPTVRAEAEAGARAGGRL